MNLDGAQDRFIQLYPEFTQDGIHGMCFHFDELSNKIYDPDMKKKIE